MTGIPEDREGRVEPNWLGAMLTIAERGVEVVTKQELAGSGEGPCRWILTVETTSRRGNAAVSDVRGGFSGAASSMVKARALVSDLAAFLARKVDGE